MIERWLDRTRLDVERGTGASTAARVVRATAPNDRTALEFSFADLGRGRSPLIELRPSGLRRHVVSARFGPFAGEVLASIGRADDEALALAAALFRTTSTAAALHMEFGADRQWPQIDRDFRVRAERRLSVEPLSEDALTETCRLIVVPMMAAFAELVGHEPVGDARDATTMPDTPGGTAEMEGALALCVVRRRERSPRNRIVCLATHGHACAACGTDPRDVYGEAGVVEVHHLQPLVLCDGPRSHDPAIDLVPLCPGCHRAAHTRRPLPLTPEEIRALMAASRG